MLSNSKILLNFIFYLNEVDQDGSVVMTQEISHYLGFRITNRENGRPEEDVVAKAFVHISSLFTKNIVSMQ